MAARQAGHPPRQVHEQDGTTFPNEVPPLDQRLRPELDLAVRHGRQGCPGPGSTLAAMLTDADLEEIRQGLRDGLRGPILLKWCQQLLAERDELAARLQALEDARDDQQQP
jgi:hypothetical protein